MAENSKIEWTDHTFNPCRSGRWLRVSPKVGLMCEGVAANAEGDAVPHIEAQVGVIGKRSDVVGVEITARIVTTMGAGKSIAAINIVAPPLQFRSVAQPTPLNPKTINVSRRVFASHSTLARSFADLLPSFQCVLFPQPVARATFSRRPHLGPAFFRHFGAA
ncbi:hypothetical protein ABIE91_009577 [Bradyrhizobium elkanii]